MFRRTKLNFLNAKDDRIKIINERISLTERHLLEMTNAFANCTRKMAKYRDSYDELAKSVKNYGDDEEINESLGAGLKSFTNAITILGDYMDLQVQRMELKIVSDMSQFEQLCKTTRDSLRTAVNARDKELLKQRQMLEIKTKFAANNSAADSELLKAKMEVQRTNKEIDEIIVKFEQTKITDLKLNLSNFILISMKYHTKALEVLTANYYDISNIDEKDDLMEFQKLMIPKEATKMRKPTLSKSMRSQSMDSLERNLHVSPLKRTAKLSRSTKNLTGDRKIVESDGEKTIEEDEDDYDEQDDDDIDDEDDDEVDDVQEESDHSQVSAEDENESGSAAENERNKKTSREHIFGIKARHKPNSVKHPFKAVAATHTFIAPRSMRSSKNRSGRAFTGNAGSSGTMATSANKSESVAGTNTTGRLVTVVESKQQQQPQQRRK